MNSMKRGFTIVELLIVIVVIAILAAITVVAFNGISRRAAESGLKTSLRSISQAADVFTVENGGAPPTSPSDLNGGSGVTVGDNESLDYRLESTGYCVDMMNTRYELAARIKSGNSVLDEGLGCRAPDNVEVVGAHFERISTVSHARNFTMPSPYSSERWIVGAIMKRYQYTEPTVTVDSASPDMQFHQVAASYGYTWFVAQPTGASTTIDYTGESMGPEHAYAIWEVFSDTVPEIVESTVATTSATGSIDGYPGGGALMVSIYSNGSPPDGTVSGAYVGGGAGWSMYTGYLWPATMQTHTLSVPHESGMLVMVRKS